MSTIDIRFALPPAPREQLVLYSQSLDDAVPGNDPVRIFRTLLEEVDWTPWEAAYSSFGQPAIHPKYLAGAIMFGLLHKLRSTRELESACRKNVDFIWLMEGFTPDHSTFADFQIRHEKSIAAFNRQMARKLMGKTATPLLNLVIDGTRIQADSSRHGARDAKFIESVIAELERRLKEMRQTSQAPVIASTGYLDGLAPDADKQEQLAVLDKEIARLEKERKKYLDALEVAHKRDERAREHNGAKAKPVRVPVADPESQVTPNKEGGYAPNYTPVAAVDPQSGAIVYSGVLSGSDEASAVEPAVAAATALTGEKPGAVLADSNFASGEVLKKLDEEKIDAYMPTRSMSPTNNPALRADPSVPVPEQDRERLPKTGGQLARTAFVYDPTADVYYCPMGHALAVYKQDNDRDGARCKYYQCGMCSQCPLVKECVKGKGPYRSIVRDEYEELREAAGRRMTSDEGKAVYRLRAPNIEGVFGSIKRALGIRRFQRRGLDKVRVEWDWICSAHNLKKLLKQSLTAQAAAFKCEKHVQSSVARVIFRVRGLMRVLSRRNYTDQILSRAAHPGRIPCTQ